mgnify:CR=1 FL=1
MKLVNIGFGSMVAAGRVLAIVAPDSAPIKRVIQEARDRGMLIDASYGRRTKAVLLMDTDHVIRNPFRPVDGQAGGRDRGGKAVSKGKMFVLSGASGVGKSTVLKRVMDGRDDLRFSVSVTTRAPRPGEIDGVHYYFVTKERFEEMIRENAFLEYDAHAGNYYGTPRAQAEEKMEQGLLLLDIEPMGAKQVKQSAPDAVLIFIMPPSREELERRLRGRGDTSEEQIKIRLERASWEMEQRSWYDYTVVNDDAKRCAEEILTIIANLAD